MTDDPENDNEVGEPENNHWADSPDGCPLCDQTYHAQLSGTVTAGTASQLDTSNVAKTCIRKPRPDKEETALFFHLEHHLND